MNYENSVIISGRLHFTSRKKNSEYFPFSIKHENLWTDGTTRRDFLDVRAFDSELQEKLNNMAENDYVRVKGVLKSAKGSGDLYLSADEINSGENNNSLENTVKLSGAMHVIKAQNEGETGTGKYIRFAVRQEISGTKDFLIIRAYDEELRKILSSKNDGDPIEIYGTLRSSRGSGVNYVRCSEIK